MDFEVHEVRVGGDEVRLSGREFRLIEVLVRSAGAVQSIGAIIAHVWGDAEATEARRQTLAVLVSWLRRKLRTGGLEPDAIVTAHGLGYYYRPPTRPARRASSPKIGYSHAERLLNPPDKRPPT